MLKSKRESSSLALWVIVCFLGLVLTTQNSFSMAAVVLPTLSSTDDPSSSSSCQQCLAQGMLMIPVCSIASGAPAFPETETNPVQIQVFKNLYPTAVECLCIANATARTMPTITHVREGTGNGSFAITGWVDLCDDQCSVSMVKALIKTLTVLSNLMACNGAAPGLGPGSSTGTAAKTTESIPSTLTTQVTRTTRTVAVPKASPESTKSVGSKKMPKETKFSIR